MTNAYITWRTLDTPSSDDYFEVVNQEIRIHRSGYFRITVQLSTTAHSGAHEIFSLRQKSDNVDLLCLFIHFRLIIVWEWDEVGIDKCAQKGHIHSYGFASHHMDLHVT